MRGGGSSTGRRCRWSVSPATASCVSDFLAALYRRQIAWMSEVRLGDGPPVVRACITSFRTTAADVERVVGEITRIALEQHEVHT